MCAYRCVVAGAMALDMIPNFPVDSSSKDQIFAEGKTVYLDGISFILGGCVSNTGVAMHRLGADTILFSKIGEDPLGAIVKELMMAENVNGHFTTVKGQKSTTTIVVVPEGCDRVFWHRRGASQEYTFADLPPEIMTQSDVFHFGYPTGMRCMYIDGGDNMVDMFSRIKQEYGLTTSMDLSVPGFSSDSGKANWREIMHRTLPYVDIFLPSIEELLFIFRKDLYIDILKKADGKYAIDYIDFSVLQELSDEILSFGVKVFGVKLGKKGIYLRTAGADAFSNIGKLGGSLGASWHDRELMDRPYKPEPYVSTNGAGDSAIAGFLAGMMDGLDPENTLCLASATAATRIESRDGVHGICSKDEILQRIHSGWKKLPDCHVDENYWCEDPITSVYFGKKDANYKNKK